MENKRMVQIGALWKKQTQSGKEMYTGNVNGVKVVVFPNGYKSGDKHPDLIVYLDTLPPKEAPKTDAVNLDDIPF